MFNSLKIGTKIGASFALGVAIFATIGLVSYRSVAQMRETSRLENQAYEVLGELEDLMSSVKDAETGQRGYIITGEDIYLNPYEEAIDIIDDQIAELEALTQNNEPQEERLDELENLISRRLEILQEVIQVRRNEDFATAAELVRTDRGKAIMDQIRELVAEMEQAEQDLLEARSQDADAAARQMILSVLLGIPLYSILLALIGFTLARNISVPLEDISKVAKRIAAGDLSERVREESDRRDEIGFLTRIFNQMIDTLQSTTQRNEEQTWLKSNLAEFTRILQGKRNLQNIAQLILSELVPLVGAQQAVFYILEDNNQSPVLKLLSSYAYQERKHLANQFRLGEGLVGQCALEKQRIVLKNVPSDYIRISSGLGDAPPLNIVVLPVLFEEHLNAVIELASFQPFSDIHLTFLDEVSESIGIVLNMIAADMRTDQLLQQSQTLTEELQSQQEELKESNQLLEEQAQSLQASEELLRQQQEELRQSNEELQQLNEELEEKAELLSVRNRDVERKNQELNQARQIVEEKVKQLALTSKYKSEFLANMSHELRTPLNSLLILARLLTDNPDGNLSDKQVEYTRTIHSAGSDLLELINEILDLAKIESGTMSVDVNPVRFDELKDNLERTFEQIAQDKELSFSIQLSDNLPEAIYTDPKRLLQVLKNLLSNAFKFTEAGAVTLQIEPNTQRFPNQEALTQAETIIAFAVQDTGIGIAPDQQQVIFEAFQQADGTTSRKYGGTGLGLSISREIAQLLGGQIQLSSQFGQGSTFTLFLPQTYIPDASEAESEPASRSAASSPAPSVPNGAGNGAGWRRSTPTFASEADGNRQAPSSQPESLAIRGREIDDDYGNIEPGDRTLLIVEDDVNFARVVADMARSQGFKVLVALRSAEGLALAQELKPDAIMLDILLPDMDGWMVLDRLKHDPQTRHIPVHILSAEEEQQRGLQLGAIAYLQKPVSPEELNQAFTRIKGFVERQVKHLLVVEDDEIQSASIRELIGNGDVQTTAVQTGADALAALEKDHFDCVVLDLGLPDMSGFDLIQQLKRTVETQNRPPIPVIIYTGKELTPQEETRLKRLAETIIIKDVRSPERLLDETALFLHRIQANLPEPKQQMLEKLHQKDSVLVGKKVLIVDDDVRNIFALTSLLERYDMDIVYAENGRDGIATLNNHPDVDVVLMDVMMPEMDGYETTRAIRAQEQFKTLPVIALTAKAMQGDREKCIEAGASDYISKPVDTEQLLSLLRVWLYQ